MSSLLAIAALSLCLQAPAVDTQQGEVERAVVESLLAEPNGSGTLADLAWPQGYLGRVADRTLREAWRERQHRVSEDPPRPIPLLPWAIGYGALVVLLGWLAARGARGGSS